MAKVKDNFSLNVDTFYISDNDLEKFAIIIFIDNQPDNKFETINLKTKELDPEILRFTFDSDNKGYFLTNTAYMNPFRDDMYNFSIVSPVEVLNTLQRIIAQVNTKTNGAYVYDIEDLIKCIEDVVSDERIELSIVMSDDEITTFKDTNLCVFIDDNYLKLDLDGVPLIEAILNENGKLTIKEYDQPILNSIHKDDIRKLDKAYVEFYKCARSYLRYRNDPDDIFDGIFDNITIRVEG